MKRFAASVKSETDENIWETVEDAYVYALLDFEDTAEFENATKYGLV